MINFFFKLIKPFLVWVGHLHLPYTRKKVTGVHYFLLRDKINIGTVLLATTNGELSNLVNPEKLKHGAIYVGDLDGNGVRYVVEAKGDGVIRTDLVSFLTSKDIVVGCEPLFLEELDKPMLQVEARRLIGIPYDYLFEAGGDALYCFEAVIRVLNGVRPEIRFKSRRVGRREFYSSLTFLEDDTKFKITFNSQEVNT